MELGIASVAAITVVAYLVGAAVKATLLFDDRYIPIICGAVGAIMGVVGLYTMADFPASDPITALAVGIVSGLAATGVNQIGKQLNKEF